MAATPKRDIRLSDEHIKTLTKLAIETNRLASVGPTAGRPSWRVFVRRLAAGEFEFTLQPRSADHAVSNG